MRAIPIDDFLERAAGGGSEGDVSAYDWGGLVAEGRAARAAADRGAWRIGDLAALVERRYRSGALKRFADEIGESPGTVRRYRWVAGTYESAMRLRFSRLSFSHFQAVAGLPDRHLWLERAQRGSWGVARLVSESRAASPVRRSREPALVVPVRAAERTLGRVIEELDRGPLPRGNRESLARAVAELAATVERLRARLRAAARG